MQRLILVFYPQHEPVVPVMPIPLHGSNTFRFRIPAYDDRCDHGGPVVPVRHDDRIRICQIVGYHGIEHVLGQYIDRMEHDILVIPHRPEVRPLGEYIPFGTGVVRGDAT